MRRPLLPVLDPEAHIGRIWALLSDQDQPHPGGHRLAVVVAVVVTNGLAILDGWPFEPGDRLTTTRMPSGTSLGAMICFEHAFPEVASTLALSGAHILVIPSAVPTGYEHLLELRTRARAQDNQVFVVASNLTGGDFFGGSLIVDLQGNVLVAADWTEGNVTADLDLGAIEIERSREPALRLRRPDLYR